ncbi:hypothetical protein BD626DRAFT_583318 [Schizophyllum amplum]|uniref:Uncharacterized protein n=1 Tax=Schizophyllum amplum TaxID=97359 RepID=A0A550CH81_9AGAR|nr:hypothetical protein BD626DRAFT_583318 [Auriculariopsis ampla]
MPLASKPPFATDLPDSDYASGAPQTRRQLAPTANPNARTSAYDVYDNYIGEKDGRGRNSGIDALGMGFMNGSMDDDDSDDEYSSARPMDPHMQPGPRGMPNPAPSGKNATLAAAAGVNRAHDVHRGPAPRLNLARPEAAATPNGRQPNGGTAPLRVQMPQSANAVSNPFATPYAGTPVPASPHPLQPPMTPITPVFARPRAADVKFAAEEKHEIMRSDKEDVLIPRRGQQGDDFWRRFSMVIKEEGSKRPGEKESSWLKKTNNGTSSLSRWVFIIGIILLICAAGAKGHRRFANEMNTGSGDGISSLQSSIRVTPTYTVDRRAMATGANVLSTPKPIRGKDLHVHRRAREHLKRRL